MATFRSSAPALNFRWTATTGATVDVVTTSASQSFTVPDALATEFEIEMGLRTSAPKRPNRSEPYSVAIWNIRQRGLEPTWAEWQAAGASGARWPLPEHVVVAVGPVSTARIPGLVRL